jgi:type IV pilus assembly protein PilV
LIIVRANLDHAMLPPLTASFRCQQYGFSLLEILISIVVLSFGVLGAVGLQASALQANREARMQSTGVRFADEIAELLQGNHSIAVLKNAAQNPYLINRSSGDTATAPACGIPNTNACGSKTAIAQRDIDEWWARLNDTARSGLAGVRAVICFDSAPYDNAGLPRWDCDNAGSTLAIKIGWTRTNTLRSATGADATSTSQPNTGAFDHALRPGVVIPVTPGIL